MYIEDFDNWKYIILVEYIGGKRDVLSNMLNLNRKQQLKKYFKKNNLKNNICFVVNDSGYSNNEIGVQ